MYCRIDLSKTTYSPSNTCVLFDSPPIDDLQKIYKQYCHYKKFDSIMPLFDSYFNDTSIDIWGYLDPTGNIVAFSIVKKHDQENVESLQFSWNYENPKLKLGFVSLTHECAVYKNLGYKYLYLGEANSYKSKLDGYEVLGNLHLTT